MENVIRKWTQSEPFFAKSVHFFRFLKRSWEATPLFSSCAPVSVAEHASISLNMLLVKDSEYAWSSCIFDRLLKMSLVLVKHCCINKGYAEFRICLIMTPYASIMAQYASISMSLNVWTWFNIAEWPWICLKMSE